MTKKPLIPPEPLEAPAVAPAPAPGAPPAAVIAQALLQAGQALLAAAKALAGPAPAAPAVLSVAAPALTVLPFPGPAESVTVIDLINAFLRYKARQGRSDRYLRAMRVSLGSFARARKSRPADSVSIEEIERWLELHNWRPRTRLGYLRDVRTAYNWGKRRGLVSTNHAAAVEIAPGLEREPAIHTPEQVATVLEFARGYRLALCRALAIQYFAGLRTAEVETLEETEIHLERGVIEIKAEKCKTRKRRPAIIRPNLAAWLALGGELPLRDLSNTWRKFRQALQKKTGLTWEANACRHSFCSYHLQAFQNAGRTALEAGNSEQMIFSHYRALVSAPAAAAYWEIRPK